MAITKKEKRWQSGESGVLVNCWWEWQMVQQTLWRKSLVVPHKVKHKFILSTAALLLGICPEELRSRDRDHRTCMFTELFPTAERLSTRSPRVNWEDGAWRTRGHRILMHVVSMANPWQHAKLREVTHKNLHEAAGTGKWVETEEFQGDG